MGDRDTLAGLRGLYQDLSSLTESSFVNIDRLRDELEAHIDDFRKLLDRPPKNNSSRQAVLSGKHLSSMRNGKYNLRLEPCLRYSEST